MISRLPILFILFPVILLSFLSCQSTPHYTIREVVITEADIARGKEISELKFGMFICWSFSTFSGQEWTPTLDKDSNYFQATGVDTDQWCETAKMAGMNYILFLTKHHDGFCLWDSATTEKKVTNSPLGIDVLASLRESCDKYDIKLALYFSEGDWNWPGAADGKSGTKGAGINPEMKKEQLRELTTQYGDIEFFWMDHAAGDGGLDHFLTTQWIHQYQPDCFVGYNHGEPYGRLVLRERGKPGPIGSEDVNWNSDQGQNEKQFKGYLAAEFTYPILPPHSGGADWFYSLPEHDQLALPALTIFQDYQGAILHQNIFSLNIGPGYNGRLRDIDVQRLQEVGKLIQELESTEIK